MEHTRRSVLTGLAAAGVVGTAGCLGGDEEARIDGSEFDCSITEPTDVDLDYRPVLGDPDASVVVQVFEDFTCGHCATYKLDHFPTIHEQYIDTNEIRYEHWDFPIPVDEEWAVPIASAARGVGAREGSDAFRAFTSAVYESHGNYDEQAIVDAADAAGVDPCAALSDAAYSAYEEALMADRDEGESMGVGGTPTVFVDGTAVDGYDSSTVSAAIDDAL